MTVLAKRTTDATIGSVLPVTTSISHSEQNATSVENQNLEAAEAAIPIDVEAVMADAVLVETEADEIPIDAEAVMVDAVLVEDEEVVTPTDAEAAMADAALVEDEEVVTPTDVEAVMADAALVETEADEIPIAEVDGILIDVEAVMADAALVETEADEIPIAEVDEILIDVEAETADVTTEAVMMIALTNVIGKHVESARVTLTIVDQNQFDHVVTKETIETIEVDLVDSRSTLS